MSTTGEGLRVGSPGIFTVRFLRKGRPWNGSLFDVTARGRFPNQQDFPIVVTPAEDADNSLYNLGIAAADLDTAADLSIEFFFDGPEVVNPNAAPLVIPVRAAYEVAA